MKLEILSMPFTVCKVKSISEATFSGSFYFAGKTDSEISVVCETEFAPTDALEREDGWRAFRVSGTLDFSLVGILARLSSLLAEAGISIFALSTYDTDYLLVKAEKLKSAVKILEENGFETENL